MRNSCGVVAAVETDESLKVDEKIRKRNRIMYRSVCLIVIAIDIENSEF